MSFESLYSVAVELADSYMNGNKASVMRELESQPKNAAIYLAFAVGDILHGTPAYQHYRNSMVNSFGIQ